MSTDIMIFEDRRDAGKKLAEKLLPYKGRKDVLLYALPRGGAVLGAEIAKVLELPFDVVVTRKIGSPSNPEYAIGSLAETGEIIWNEAERDATYKNVLDRAVKNETAEEARRIQKFRHGRELPDMSGKTVILIDDGVATGYTLRAGIAVAKNKHAGKIIIAVPHGAKESLDGLRKEVDEVVALDEPAIYGAVGAFYREFPQIEDKEVVELLSEFGPK